MKEGKEVLRSFCQAHMRQRSDSDLSLTSLDGFFARGACGRYTLSPEGRVPEDMLLRTMMSVTGWRFVVNVNFTRQQCRPAEHHPDCEACFGVTELERSIGELTKSSLEERYLRPLKDEIGGDAYREMSDVFMHTLGEPVWHSFECVSWQDFRIRPQARRSGTGTHGVALIHRTFAVRSREGDRGAQRPPFRTAALHTIRSCSGRSRIASHDRGMTLHEENNPLSLKDNEGCRQPSSP